MKTTIYILVLLLLSPLINATTYGSGTYGSGCYGGVNCSSTTTTSEEITVEVPIGSYFPKSLNVTEEQLEVIKKRLVEDFGLGEFLNKIKNLDNRTKVVFSLLLLSVFAISLILLSIRVKFLLFIRRLEK